MVLTMQQQKFKVMLEEAITLLCRSSLPYKSEASVEALIGITVDCDDVFLISVKEKFDNKMPDSPLHMNPENDMFSDDDSLPQIEDDDILPANLQENHKVGVVEKESFERSSKKRKRDIDKLPNNNNMEPQPIVVDEDCEGHDDDDDPVKQIGLNSQNVDFHQPRNHHNIGNFSNLVCDITEIKSEQLYDSFLNHCFNEDPMKFRLNTGYNVFSDYNSKINVKVEKFPMPNDVSDMKPPNLTSLQIAMASEILNISGSFVNIGSAKAFQHNLRVLSKSELSEVVNNMSLPPSNPYSVGVLCTEGVSRVFYKIPPALVKQEALDFFRLDIYSYNNLYHSSVRVPHNIRDPEEWKALVTMKNPFSFPADSSSIRT